MSNWLFEHNQIAYDAAMRMLADTGKAAIIHPTGTGKSFIGFKLCMDHPNQTVCWLSPSSYIFETQLENLEKVIGKEAPSNIRFFTYAKLMLLTDNEIAEIKPDFIVLDEFHRCGAEMWGTGVQALLSAYLHIPILGLSATAIRYLDNQRDMADELFDGNVASEITLGEAIVRGILNPPKYVLSAYSYQNDLEKYQRRIRRHTNRAVQDEAQYYLDALRRALDMADGMDTIFAKHITKRSGKYIVFCSNAEHMREMIDKVPEWFHQIDTQPNIYSAYSSDPETSQAFSDFKVDVSDHLKLLFCIDMLNEGIHVDDIDGVILLRPTVSPIIYKQQIGRALSANKSREVFIFDVVMNIMNLYSIGALRQEMDAAISYYRFWGEEQNIITEHFQVFDELHDCTVLFEKLNDTLTASWDVMYRIAKQYYQQHGNLTPTNRYKTAEGYSLGNWLATQRAIRKGTVYGVLTEEQIQKLDEIGMRWENHLDVKWDKFFSALQKYREEFGNIDVRGDYVAPSGLALGQWVQHIRSYRNARIQTSYLTPQRIQDLDNLGMIWDKLDYLWEQNYQAATEYYQKNRNLKVPRRYISEDGIALGSWLHRIKAEYRDSEGKSLTSNQIERLEAIGMVFDDIEALEQQWQIGFNKAKEFYLQNGNLNVPYYFTTDDGFRLGEWIRRQRKLSQNDSKKRIFVMPEDRIEKLNEIGMIWKPLKHDSWEQYLELTQRYYAENKNLDIRADEKYEGAWLGRWLNRQRSEYRSGRLAPKKIEALNALGFCWTDLKTRQRDEAYARAVEFYERNGHLSVPRTEKTLYTWILSQRAKYRDGKLTVEEIEALNAIGMVWEIDDNWESFFSEAKQFYEDNGHLDIPATYTTASGVNLGKWYRSQRDNYRNGSLDQSKIKRLESIGIQWQSVKIRTWMKYYELAKVYFHKHGNLQISSSYVTDEGIKLGVWISSQREQYAKNKLHEEQITLLEQICMEWNRFDNQWEQGYAHAKAYRDTEGSLNVAASYISTDGFKLGAWISTQRNKYKTDKLTNTQVERLNALGMVWSPQDALWEEVFLVAKTYAQENGTLDLSSGFITKNGVRLGQWLYNQKKKYKANKLDPQKTNKLLEIGIQFE